MRVRRPLIALCTTVPLVLAAAGCSDFSGGLIMGTDSRGRTQTFSAPVQNRCYRFAAGGITAVTNSTGADIILHKNADCTDPGKQRGAYVGATLRATAGPTQTPWRSFATTGWPPPVPVN
ncbi:hypothetical protein [Streptomyces sp. NBC_01190]|uniref:hypothetical protein n=1 Tax=Streptomyces sp. NBC_01190 TaxID=2903767 RepID=UPI00386A6C14|nr:hypothetical protein OG519_16595 [Streptomyces sp. NBC_01190]